MWAPSQAWEASGDGSSVGGGYANKAGGWFSSVGGGYAITVTTAYGLHWALHVTSLMTTPCRSACLARAMA